MNKKLLRFLTSLFIFGVLFVADLLSQNIYFLEVLEDEFPTIRAPYVARNGTGDSLEMPWEQFKIYENDVDMTESIDIDCSFKGRPGISLVLLMDYSVSMFNDDAPNGEKKIEWLKYAVHAFLDSLKYVNDTKIAAIFFGNRTEQESHNLGFATNAQPIHDAIDYMKVIIGFTDYEAAFFGSTYEPFKLLAAKPENMQRHIIFISDGTPDKLVTYEIQDSIIANAIRSQTYIHTVAVTGEMDEGMKDVAFKTSGKQLYAQTKEDLKRKMLSLVNVVQREYTCELEWQAPYGCDEASRNRNIRITRTTNSGTRTLYEKSYTAPPRSVTITELSEDNLFFGAIGSGETEKEITLTHQGDDFTCNGIAFDPADKGFEVKNWGGAAPPFTISNGDSRIIRIGYKDSEPPTNSGVVEMSLLMDDYPCDLPTVDLVSLCGGTPTPSADFDPTDIGQKTTQTLTYAFKNSTATPIEVTASVKGDHASDFVITSGGGKTTLNPAQNLEVVVDFVPTYPGPRTAYIEYKLPDDCGGDYRTNLSGTATGTSVEEYLLGNNSGNGLKINLSPNPASDQVRIYFETHKSGSATLELYNTVGNLVETLVSKELVNGSYESFLNVKDLATGVYFIKLQTGSHMISERLIITR